MIKTITASYIFRDQLHVNKNTLSVFCMKYLYARIQGLSTRLVKSSHSVLKYNCEK